MVQWCSLSEAFLSVIIFDMGYFFILVATTSMFHFANAEELHLYKVSLYFDLPKNSNTCDPQNPLYNSNDVDEELSAKDQDGAVKETKALIGMIFRKEFGINCPAGPNIKRRPIKNKKIIGAVLKRLEGRKLSQSYRPVCKLGVVRDFRVSPNLEGCKVKSQ